MEKFGDEALVKKLMPSYSIAKVWLRLSFFLLAFFFFVIGISRPQMGAILKEHKTRGAEVMIVLDVSNSMLAEDYSPNRLYPVSMPPTQPTLAMENLLLLEVELLPR